MDKRRLLVVEDEALIAEDLLSQLRNLGYQDVTVCHTLAKARAVLDKERFDLALVDILFKNKKDGLTLGRLLRDEYRIPHIFVTAHSDKTILDKAAATHPVGYIVKPVEEEQLRITIRMALNRYELEKQLAHQEHFNRLRGDIWEVAGQAESVDDLVFRILHLLGPAMQVHRAAFFEKDEGRKLFELRRQWHRQKGTETPGVRIPSLFLDQYRGKKHIIITPSGLPGTIKKAGRAMLEKYGVRSMLVVPFGREQQARGFFSFTDCGDENRVWTAEEKDILTETGTIFQAVSNRLQAERKAAEAGDRARQYLEMASSIFISLDLDGTILMISRAGLAFLGYSAEETVGKNWFDLCIPKKSRKEMRAVYDGLMKGELEPQEFLENTVLTRDGRERQVMWHNAFAYDADGRKAGVLASGTDVTEQKRGQQLLDALNRAGRAMEDAVTRDTIFKSVTSTLHAMDIACSIMLYDKIQGTLCPEYLSQDSRILKAAEKLAGISRSRFSIQVDDYDFYKKVVHGRETALLENTVPLMKQLLPRMAGPFIPKIIDILKVNRFIAAPLIVDNELIGIFTVQSADLSQRDIPSITAFAQQVSAAWHKARLLEDLQKHLDELKKTQEQLLFSQKQQAIGQLAGGVAHDFNNLLTVIKGNAELMMRKTGEDHPLERYLRPLHESAERAAELTRQLLMYSRKAPMDHEPVDLNAAVETVRKMLVRVIGEDIRIKTSLTTGLSPVLGDAGTLQQVLMNLAINARDAMPAGGTLAFETDNVVLDQTGVETLPGAAPGKYVLLAVSDTGEGMTENIREHIFDPFFTTKEVGKGTGLGLAVVYGVIKQHNGWIFVDSAPDSGSAFRIWLPAAPQEAAACRKTEKKEEIVRGTSRRVLLVEDEPGVRGFVTEALTEHGFVVVPVPSAAAARRTYAEDGDGFDLVFSDVVLPDENGIGLADAILTDNPEQRVILTSGYTDDRSRLEEINRRNLAFLSKPFTLSDLLRIVRETLDGT